MANTTSINKEANVHAYASKESAKEAGHQAMEAGREAISQVEANLRQTAERLSNTAEKLGQDARNMVDGIWGQTRDVGTQVQTRIKDQPVQSSLYALGIGFALGFLMTRR